MSASFGIAMIGVAAMLAMPIIIALLRGRGGSLELSGLVAVALFSALASCVASGPRCLI